MSYYCLEESHDACHAELIMPGMLGLLPEVEIDHRWPQDLPL